MFQGGHFQVEWQQTDKIDRKMKAKLENLLAQAEIQLTDLQKDLSKTYLG